uniref:Uncharacterized protein n=1 Tax=Anguilla anguilla TaxID=7936 RepID=A0A0E9VST2_ANGAN
MVCHWYYTQLTHCIPCVSHCVKRIRLERAWMVYNISISLRFSKYGNWNNFQLHHKKTLSTTF